MPGVPSPLVAPTPHPRLVTTPCMANNMTPDIQRTTTSPETLQLEDTGLVRKPACESTQRRQNDEQTSNTTPVQRLAMRRMLDVGGWKTLKKSMMKTQGIR